MPDPENRPGPAGELDPPVETQLAEWIEHRLGKPMVDRHRFDLEIRDLIDLVSAREPTLKERRERLAEIENHAGALARILPPPHDLPRHLDGLPDALLALARWAEGARAKVPEPRRGRPENETRLVVARSLERAWTAATGKAPTIHRQTGQMRDGPFVDFAREALTLIAPDQLVGDLGQRLDDELRDLRKMGIMADK